MKVLKLNTQLRDKISDLERNRMKLNSTIEHDIEKIFSYQKTINAILLNKKSYGNYLKISLRNEELIKAHYSLMQIIIDNNDKLIQIKASKERKTQLKGKGDAIVNGINDLQSSIDQISKDIISANKACRFDSSFEGSNYIINPTKEHIENFNEICIQKELMIKFKKKSIETLSLISERSKAYVSLKRELQALKRDRGIRESRSIANDSTIIPNTESIGSLDDEIENNIDSPKFLKKVKKTSKINFALNKKLELNSVKLNQLGIQAKDQKEKKAILNDQKPIKVDIFQVEPKKPEDKWKNVKAGMNNNKLSINEELDQTNRRISELTVKLGELLFKNRVLISKQHEADIKNEAIDKKIKLLEITIEESKGLYEPYINDDDSSEVTDEIDVLANADLYPLSA